MHGARLANRGRTSLTFLLCWALLALLLTLVGCEGHAASTREIRNALDVGRPQAALNLINDELDVDEAEQLPEDVGGNNALLLLDRAMILQQLERLELSSRDLQVADKQVEILDFSQSAVTDVARYLYSDEAGPYRAPPYEKLLINTMNMMNYLARGDLSGARIEARRLAVMQRYFKDREDPAKALLGPGSYLAGFVFEKSGKPNEALRYYDEALAYGSYRTLREPVARLLERASYSSPRLREFVEKSTPQEPRLESREADTDRATNTASDKDTKASPLPREAEAPEKGRSTKEAGEILIIVNFGRVPAKHAKRVPIGLALTYASGHMSPEEERRASYLAAQGLVTWVNYPVLGKPHGEMDRPKLWIDKRGQLLEGIAAVDREAKEAWQEARGAVMASAITRMLSRVVAGEVIRQGSGGDGLGALLSLGTQAALTVADTPDTRSWSTLPARIAMARVRVPPGEHEIRISARGETKERRVEVAPGGWAAVVHTVLN